MTAAPPAPPGVSPWRLVTWTDEHARPVARLGCHADEVAAVLDLPPPFGAVVREPVTELTNLTPGLRFHSRRRPCPFAVGDCFTENINQGDRHCRVVAVNDATGQFLYDYEMPGGRVFLRDQDGRPVSRARVPRWAREWLD